MSEFRDKLLREKIAAMKEGNNVYAVGTVLSINGHIIEVGGLEGVAFFEKVYIGETAFGYVSAIKRNGITVTLVRNSGHISINDQVRTAGEEFRIRFSDEYPGHIIDIFAFDLLTGKAFDKTIDIPVENPAVPLMDRGPVCRPLQTGIAGIDLMYPIGRGQRQLIVGAKRTGKTQVALDIIANQHDQDIECIYVAIGKTKKEIKEIHASLAVHGALSYTTIIAALNDDFPSILSLTPYAALSIAEQYLFEGKDVLVVIDDLKRHADAYREIGLMGGKAPGRDAYPSDMFHHHSRLLEKGCQHKNGGSITILPLVESLDDDITAYITTNVISITDGQIVLSRKAFDKGQKPAIDYGLSVSRLGGAVQRPELKKLGAQVRRELLSYLEMREVFEFAGQNEMGETMRARMETGSRLLEALNQYRFENRSVEKLVAQFTSLIGGES